jgi:hypothetical protein
MNGKATNYHWSAFRGIVKTPCVVFPTDQTPPPPLSARGGKEAELEIQLVGQYSADEILIV